MRRFYSSLGLLVLLNAVVKPLWIFAIDRQVQNVVGTETYGVYFALLNLSVVLSFLADWGFTPYFNQSLAAGSRNYSDLTGRFLLLKLVFVISYLAILFAAGWISGIQRWDILLYVGLIQVFTSLFIFFRSIITANQWFKTDAWLSVTDKTLMIIACGLLLYAPAFSNTMTIEIFLLLQTIFLAMAMIVAFIYLLNNGIRFSFGHIKPPGKEVIQKVLPFGAIVLLMSAHNRIDAFLLERIHPNGAYESGIYAAAYRLLDAANVGGYLVASFMLPYIARRWSDKEEINTVILQCRHYLLMFSVGVIVLFLFESLWIERILYHHKDDYAVEILQWCLPAIAGYSLVHVYGTVMTATGRAVDFCYVILGGLIINTLLNLFLIPAWGAKGCCLAAFCSQVFCGIVSFVYARQKLGVWFHLRSLLIYIFTGLLLAIFFYTARNWMIAEWILILMAIIISVIIMLLSKLSGIQYLFHTGKDRTNK